MFQCSDPDAMILQMGAFAQIYTGDTVTPPARFFSVCFISTTKRMISDLFSVWQEPSCPTACSARDHMTCVNVPAVVTSRNCGMCTIGIGEV